MGLIFRGKGRRSSVVELRTCVCVLSPSSNLSEASKIVNLPVSHVKHLVYINLKSGGGGHKHGRNLQSKLMGCLRVY